MNIFTYIGKASFLKGINLYVNSILSSILIFFSFIFILRFLNDLLSSVISLESKLPLNGYIISLK